MSEFLDAVQTPSYPASGSYSSTTQYPIGALIGNAPITAISPDGSVLVILVPETSLIAMKGQLRNAEAVGLDGINTSDLLTAFHSGYYSRLVIAYDNVPSGVDLSILPSETSCGDNAALVVKDQVYYSTIMPRSTYEQFFGVLSDLDAESCRLLFEHYGDEYRSHRRLFKERQKTSEGLFYQSFNHQELPHMAWFRLCSEEGKTQLFDSLRLGYDAYSYPQKMEYLGVQLNSVDLALPQSQLFMLYRTEPRSDRSRHSELNPEALISDLANWDAIVIGLFAMKDGRIQVLFLEGTS